MTEERVRKVLVWRKTTLWVLLVLCILEFLQKDSVLNGLWLFCTAGVVPWQKQPLAPDTVLMILAGVVGAVLLAVIARLVIRLVGRRATTRRQRGTPQVPEVAILAKAHAKIADDKRRGRAMDSTASVAPLQQAHQLPHPPVIITKKRETSSLSLMPLLRVGAYLLAYIVWMMRFLEVLAGIIMRHLTAVSKRCATSMHRNGHLAVQWSTRTVVAGARWLTPHLWRFDAWLEKQTRQWVLQARKKVAKHQKLHDLALFGRETRRAIASRITGVRRAKNESDTTASTDA